MNVICPNEACLASIDLGDPTFDCGQYDGQETRVVSPCCGRTLLVTTHIEYTAGLAPESPLEVG